MVNVGDGLWHCYTNMTGFQLKNLLLPGRGSGPPLGPPFVAFPLSPAFVPPTPRPWLCDVFCSKLFLQNPHMSWLSTNGFFASIIFYHVLSCSIPFSLMKFLGFPWIHLFPWVHSPMFDPFRLLSAFHHGLSSCPLSHRCLPCQAYETLIHRSIWKFS